MASRNTNETPPRNMILIGVIVVATILLLIPRLFGGGDNSVDNGDRNTNDTTAQTVDDGIDLGAIVVSESIDRDGCAVSSESTLSRPDEFWVIAQDSEIPQGTAIFVRLYQDGQPIEDLPEIVANQDYDSTCINFVFETTGNFDFEPGMYEAEFFVNGNAYDSVTFEIQ